jgi:hypothetical protein
VTALTKRLEAIERKPDDFGAMQRTIGKLDATCAQLQNTMRRYFGSGSDPDVIDLVPASRRN